MPILHVKALPQPDDGRISRAMKKTAREIAAVYGCAPRQVWVTWEEIAPHRYVEARSGRVIAGNGVIRRSSSLRKNSYPGTES